MQNGQDKLKIKKYLSYQDAVCLGGEAIEFEKSQDLQL